MPCLVLGSRNVLDKCSWWADGVFQGWCWFCIKVTDPSIPFSVGSSLGCCAFCQRPHKTKRHFLTSLCLLPLFSLLLRVLLSRADGIIWKGGNDPLLIAPQAKALLICIHKANIYSQPSIFIVHVHCVVFIAPYGLSFGATCAHSTACARVELHRQWSWFPLCGRVSMKWNRQILQLHRISSKESTDFYIHSEINP